MDNAAVLFTAIFILAGIGAGAQPNCPASWALYESENVCVKPFAVTRNWYTSRLYCQKFGGDLVQIFNEEKEKFLTEMLSQSPDGNWVGAIDWNDDKSFEYINGTIMTPGTEGWRVILATDYYIGLTCLYIRTTGFATDACTYSRMFICEIKLISTKVDQVSTTCTLKRCLCKRDEWLHSKKWNKYVIVNKVARNYSISSLICEELGGRLLTIPDVETQTLIKDSLQWVPSSTYYWIGLSKVNNSKWQWTDGNMVTDDSYYNWFRDTQINTAECVSVIWGYNALWRITDCSSEQYHICEVTVPCETHAVISVNNKRQTDKSTVTLVNKQNVTIQCSFTGYAQPLSQIQVGCGQERERREAGRKSATKSYYIDSDMDNITCVCQLLFEIGTIAETGFTMRVESSPHFVGGQLTNETTIARIGAKVIREFEVFANPKPINHKLTKNGFEIHNLDYDVFVFPLKNKELHYTIVLDMHTLQKNETGEYVLTIGNGVEKDMEYVFSIEAIEDIKNRKRYTLFLLTGFGLSIFWMCLFMALVWRSEAKFHATQQHNAKLYTFVSRCHARSAHSRISHRTSARKANSQHDDDGHKAGKHAEERSPDHTAGPEKSHHPDTRQDDPGGHKSVRFGGRQESKRDRRLKDLGTEV